MKELHSIFDLPAEFTVNTRTIFFLKIASHLASAAG